MRKQQKRIGGRRMKGKIYKLLMLAVIFSFILIPVTVSAEEADGETEYISMEDDPEVTVETADEILMPTYSTAYALNWNVANKIFKQTKEFKKTAGSTVTVQAVIKPTTKNVRIGIKRSDGVQKYVNATSSVSKTFSIAKTDKYRVFVQNKSGKTITVKGSYKR